MAKVLVEQFGIAGIGTVEDDMKLFFGQGDPLRFQAKRNPAGTVLSTATNSQGFSTSTESAMKPLFPRARSDFLENLTASFVLALPIFPGRRQPSIVGAGELNCRVRNGNGWTLTAINTNYLFLS